MVIKFMRMSCTISLGKKLVRYMATKPQSSTHRYSMMLSTNKDQMMKIDIRATGHNRQNVVPGLTKLILSKHLKTVLLMYQAARICIEPYRKQGKNELFYFLICLIY